MDGKKALEDDSAEDPERGSDETGAPSPDRFDVTQPASDGVTPGPLTGSAVEDSPDAATPRPRKSPPGIPFTWREAEDSIYDYAYDRIADIARRRLAKERGNITFQPTDLVNEAWLKLHGNDTPITDREHFVALAAIAIRQVLIDHLRRRRAEKHGGKMDRIDVTLCVFEDERDSAERRIDLVDLDAQFKKLEAIDAERARAVELRLFGSMEYESIGKVMDITVYRAKQLVKAGLAWLRSRLDTDTP